MNLSSDQEKGISAAKDWFLSQSGSTFYLGGYAGTGKTTVAKLLAGEAQNPMFAAYTGRAALQLQQKSGFAAQTLHSLLYKPRRGANGQVTFVFEPEDSPLWECDNLLIDEASMVPGKMEKELLHFPNLRITLIGDPAQLPPPNNSGGLIAGRQPDVLLTQIHRQAADNPVIRLATAVREGKGLMTGQFGQSCVMSSRNVVETAVASQASMVLAGTKKTVRKLNLTFRGGKDTLPEVDEPLLALQNNHELGIMNGSLWRLKDAEAIREELRFLDPEKPRYEYRVSLQEEKGDKTLDSVFANFGPAMGFEYEYERGMTPMDFGYCLTVHKAQGSEWPEVCLINESGVFRDAAKQWLYTGLTRAQQNVLVLNGRA